MRFQRVIQTLTLLLFLLLLWRVAYPLPAWEGLNVFLKLDPLIALGTAASSRAVIEGMGLAVLVLLITLVLGRFFCGHICPMGTTLDVCQRFIKGKNKSDSARGAATGRQYRKFKYLILFFVAGTSLLGISSVFLFSPLSIITRFYSLVIYPLFMLILGLLLETFRPLSEYLGMDALSLVSIKTPYFNTNVFVMFLMATIICLGLLAPRFWCRNLCPAGAIFAILSFRPFFRRRVSEDCTLCGRCARACPAAAIDDDFFNTSYSECIVCLKCQELCPEDAISFFPGWKRHVPAQVDMGKRRLLGAFAAGMGTAAVSMTNLRYLHELEHPKALRSARLIRPPGALPESGFQARCVRCGLCMKGCLTNTLQPVWWEAGMTGVWTPMLFARFAGCEQNCNICGWICPTGAIRPLDLEEKKFAKVGTARIIKSRCIAWEQDKKCLICDEICPYNAISHQPAEGKKATVPVVEESRCNGCGYCEMKCPVKGESAIVIEPTGELRLSSGSYKKRALELGLKLNRAPGTPYMKNQSPLSD